MVQEEGITKLLMAPADLKKEIPGISGTRALNDNLSDMKAQVASNFKGIGLVTALIEEYTLEVVQAYMHHIQVGHAPPPFPPPPEQVQAEALPEWQAPSQAAVGHRRTYRHITI